MIAQVLDGTRSRPPMRLARALALACVATVIGAASHVLSGGPVTVTGAVCTLPTLVALTWPITDRERGWLTILGVQLAGQQMAHALFDLGAGTDHAAASVSGPLPVDVWFYGHVLAAVVVSIWLRHGERRTWAAARRAADTLVRHWRRLLALLAERHDSAPPGAPAVGATDQPAVATHLPLRHSVIRRGPPLLA